MFRFTRKPSSGGHLKIRKLLQHVSVYKEAIIMEPFKNKEAAPTCFGLQGSHHQGAI